MKRTDVRPSFPSSDHISSMRGDQSGERSVPASLGGPGAARPATAQLMPGALRVPHDPINEQILLAAACRSKDRRAELLRSAPAEHFFCKDHAAFWATLAELDARGLEFGFDTVHQLSGGKLDRAYFEGVVAQRPDVPPNLQHHVEVLRWDAARVLAAHGPLADVIDAFRDQATEPAVLAAAARRLAEDLSQAAPLSGTYDSQALLAGNRAAYEARKIGCPVWPYGLDGFEQDAKGLWRVKPGCAPGDVTVLTGVSGSGKSIVSKAIANGQARREVRVLFGAWEEQAGPTLEHLGMMSLGLDRNAVDEGRLDPEDEARLFAEQERIAASVRFLRQPPRAGRKAKLTIEGRIDWVFSEAQRVGARVIVLDLFSRLLVLRRIEEEQAAWEHLQGCARETGIHVVANHQQRLKDVESRSDCRPTREGAKGSAGVVEVADTMIGVYRPAVHRSVEDNVMELILLKQRKGRWPFAVRFDFDPVRVQIAKGREVAYLRPGEDGLDDVVDRPGRRRSER